MKKWLKKHKQCIFLALLSIIVTFVYRFPDVYAYLTTPPGTIFLGQNTWFDPHDVNVYVSAIHHGQQGFLLFPNVWSALPNQPIIFYPIETLLGFLFRSVNPYLVFWLASIVCGIALIAGMFLLIKKSGLSSLLTAATTLGVALGGGFGFLLYPYITSADIANILTFYETFLKTHEAIGIGCYLYSLILFYEMVTTDSKSNIGKTVLIALSLILACLIYPYLIAPYLLITCSFLFLYKRERAKLQLAYIFIPAILTVLFMTWQLSLNSGFSQLTLQHFPAKPMETIFGYGILLPIFCYQLFFMKKTPFQRYLSLWILLTLFLAFLPFGPGKLLLRGLFFPLVLVAVLQLKILFSHIAKSSISISLWLIFFMFLCATNITIMFLRISSAQATQAIDIIYMPEDEFKIFTYLNKHTQPDTGILAGELMSNLIPAYTHNRGSLGSMISITSTHIQELNAVNAFYSGHPISKKYLQKNNVSYVLWGPNEKEITNMYTRGNIIEDLSQIYPNLKQIYATRTTKLYKVTSLLPH